MKQITTEAKAWQVIAERLERVQTGWTWESKFSYPQWPGCLCFCVSAMEMAGEITWDLRRAMDRRVGEHLKVMDWSLDVSDEDASAYLDARGVLESRILAAQLLALEAAE